MIHKRSEFVTRQLVLLLLLVMLGNRDVIVKWREFGEVVMEGVERVLVVGGLTYAVMIWLRTGH